MDKQRKPATPLRADKFSWFLFCLTTLVLLFLLPTEQRKNLIFKGTWKLQIVLKTVVEKESLPSKDSKKKKKTCIKTDPH